MNALTFKIMPAPYSEHLRNRIILLRYGAGQSTQEVANNVHLSRRTVLRVCNRFEQDGAVQH